MLPLRFKLILSFLMTISLGGIVTLILGTRLEHRTIIGLAQAKVRHDLAAAWMVYNETLSDIEDIVTAEASREPLQNQLAGQGRQALSVYLQRVKAKSELDILTLTDAGGKVLARASNPESFGDDQSQNPMIRTALNGRAVTSTQIIPREELLKESETLAEKALMRVIPTPKASPASQEFCVDGMMLKAAAPLYSQNGELLGVLYGGILLNRNFPLVDRIKELVYKDEQYQGIEIGTATIFQHALRISTNVRNSEGERALGTRVSEEVRRAVLTEGSTWTDRAFVVNDWYLTAYEPIRNIDQEIIGILYVGMLEKPYIHLRNRVMATFTGMAALCVLILLILLTFIISSIVRPLQVMVEATNTIARGDLNHHVDIPYHGEVGQLALSFNQMTEELNKANAKLVKWGKTMEKRVEERTRDLMAMQKSLAQSEKLASLGKMAAGVAHEINNPLTSILINTHLLMETKDQGSEEYESLDMIEEETRRCSDIVKGLLEFARQSPPQKNPVDLNELLVHIINILRNQATFQNIVIHNNLQEGLPMTEVDPNQIKQVFWNLMINAAEAMPRGGTLTITSRLSPSLDTLEISFQDTGVGIPENALNKIFDPFFTTKQGGTGLGLAIIYGIAQEHGGTIDVTSKPGGGSVFTVRLPVAQTKRGEKE